MTLKPQFEALDLAIAGVCFNEINFSDAAPFEAGDWIELANPEDSSVTLGGWIFRDNKDGHAFVFADSATIPPHGFLVLVNDSSAFRAVYGEQIALIGDFDFGIASGGDHLQLVHPSGVIVDSLSFGREFPWPQSGAQRHFTFELKLQAGDNSIAENWQLSGWILGSPGAENSDPSARVPPLRLSEINFLSDDSLTAGDWLEIYNPTDSSIGLINWKLQNEDENTFYNLPAGLEIAPRDFLILCRDAIAFSERYPWVKNKNSQLPFALNDSSGRIRLRQATGLHVDSLRFGTGGYPGFNGRTLELYDETQANLSQRIWRKSVVFGGTPGLPNSISAAPRTALVINEINISDTLAGQWFELFNPVDSTVDLTGWSFQNSQQRCFFPAATQISGNAFLVVVADTDAFSASYPQVIYSSDCHGFQLKESGEQLILRDSNSITIDSLAFANGGSWPQSQPGHTLELRHDSLDNRLGTNWQNSAEPGGTPGLPNSILPTDMPDRVVNNLPAAFRLYANFPNPFNPATTLRFDLPEKSHVRLEVFNIMGQHIDTIIDGKRDVGTIDILWQLPAQNTLASGIYILHFQASGTSINFSDSRKMLFIK